MSDFPGNKTTHHANKLYFLLFVVSATTSHNYTTSLVDPPKNIYNIYGTDIYIQFQDIYMCTKIRNVGGKMSPISTVDLAGSEDPAAGGTQLGKLTPYL